MWRWECPRLCGTALERAAKVANATVSVANMLLVDLVVLMIAMWVWLMSWFLMILSGSTLAI